jgi:hypothetical protein
VRELGCVLTPVETRYGIVCFDMFDSCPQSAGSLGRHAVCGSGKNRTLRFLSGGIISGSGS